MNSRDKDNTGKFKNLIFDNVLQTIIKLDSRRKKNENNKPKALFTADLRKKRRTEEAYSHRYGSNILICSYYLRQYRNICWYKFPEKASESFRTRQKDKIERLRKKNSPNENIEAISAQIKRSYITKALVGLANAIMIRYLNTA